ncbi:uncharacterized protein EI97DRAFT_143270 [Westerdykella ornata]|uniref:HPP transmembrane region domain-containing protein n=1 Tax=Westerdykella ornata TaxID=318751 RepID=A0A6A6JF11_WESOR|nr:uncharacterized protein EI97DRAFT_143270 [Westerdykella ornata]KAF2273769.1 hypothetical protein EI97DRAFT_143270 [Westerdykella ornata]
MNRLYRKARTWHLDIDYYLNRFIPPSPLYRFHPLVSRFLGYRREQSDDLGNVLCAFWSALGAFCGLAVIVAVFKHSELIQKTHPPVIIASFGASAILEYNAIRSPLGQPRNAALGHCLSAIVGVGITKLFLLHSDFEKIRWIAGAVSCGAASAVMLLTGTVHPPGGASAVLAATDPVIIAMGWAFVGLVTLGTVLMLLVSLVINNIQRQFPVYWWTPEDLRLLREIRKRKGDAAAHESQRGVENWVMQGGEDVPPCIEESMYGREIKVTAFSVHLPEDFALKEDEVRVLEHLRDRLRERHEVEKEKIESANSANGRKKEDGATSSDGSGVSV